MMRSSFVALARTSWILAGLTSDEASGLVIWRRSWHWVPKPPVVSIGEQATTLESPLPSSFNARLVWLQATNQGHEEKAAPIASLQLEAAATIQSRCQSILKQNNNNNRTTEYHGSSFEKEEEEERHAGWVGRMMDYLRSERNAIFGGGHRVAIVVNSCETHPGMASKLTGIANVDHEGGPPSQLCFVVSPQDSFDGCSCFGEGGGRILSDLQTLSGDDACLAVVDSTEFEEVIDDTDEIGVVVLATNSPGAVLDDPYVNDFLRRTDAWIHMGAEFGDDFCYYSRLQEGANITLWG